MRSLKAPFKDWKRRRALSRAGIREEIAVAIVAGLESGDDVQLVEHAVAIPITFFECGWLSGQVLRRL